MRLSTKTLYGMRAMLDLAINGWNSPVCIREIADRQQLPRKYLEQVLGTLRAANLVRSTRGPQGGYTLARTPEQITLREIFDAFEGSDGFVQSPPDPEAGDAYQDCVTQEVWGQMYAACAAVLESRSLECPGISPCVPESDRKWLQVRRRSIQQKHPSDSWLAGQALAPSMRIRYHSAVVVAGTGANRQCAARAARSQAQIPSEGMPRNAHTVAGDRSVSPLGLGRGRGKHHRRHIFPWFRLESAIMSDKDPSEKVLSVLREVQVAAVATSAGDRVRNRMMHYSVDENFNIYLATMKGDPKTIQITNCPSIALLICKTGADFNDSQEVELTGKAFVVSNEKERQRALDATAQRSPVVKHLVETENDQVLECIRVTPITIKHRVFREIVQGIPPTIMDFAGNRGVVSNWELLRIKGRSWWLAFRVPFLTATVVPILLGTAIAWTQSAILDWAALILSLIAGLALHLGTNLLNDYADHVSGNDEANREYVRPFSGGSRAIQSGLLTPLEVLTASLLFFTLGSLVGLYLAWTRGLFILVLGAVALVSGLFYTGRPFNWASRGIGETVVGLNFGILMVVGAYYVQVGGLSWVPVVAGIPVSLLISAVIYVNEFPDYSADKAVGKRNLVVRLGRRKAVWLFAVLLGTTYAAIVAGVAAGIYPRAALLGLITLPVSLRAIQHTRRHYDSSFDLVPANALTIVAHLATGLLLTLAYAWEAVGQRGIGYVAILGAAFTAFVIYMYRHVERQKEIFVGVQQTMR